MFQIKMKKCFLMILSVYIFLIDYCQTREIDSPQKILKQLTLTFNEDFNPKQEIVINNKYHFNITSIRPFFIYRNNYSDNGCINIFNPKLVLFFNSELYIRHKSNVNFYVDQSTEYEKLAVNISTTIFFENITLNKLKDNSYIFDYSFSKGNLSDNIELVFNYIDDYSFPLMKDITKEEKTKFVDLYFNHIKKYLMSVYPLCDGLFFLIK
jgi:hypothetical protein